MKEKLTNLFAIFLSMTMLIGVLFPNTAIAMAENDATYKIVFETDKENVQLTVKDLKGNKINPSSAAFTYELTPGKYQYSAVVKGYKNIVDRDFEVTKDSTIKLEFASEIKDKVHETKDSLKLETSDEQIPQALKDADINVDNLYLIAKTKDKYYGAVAMGNGKDTSKPKILYELTKEQYEAASKNFFMTFKRKDGASFTILKSELAEDGTPPGKIFQEVRLKHHQAYTSFIDNFSPTTEQSSTEPRWSISLNKDWVIEKTDGFGDNYPLNALLIDFPVDINGNSNRIYQQDPLDNNDDKSSKITTLINIQKPDRYHENDLTVQFKDTTIDGENKYRGIYAWSRTNLVFDTGVILQNCYTKEGFDHMLLGQGAGIYLAEKNNFIMNPNNIKNSGNRIENCVNENWYGGAIYASDYTDITINGGEFLNNSSRKGGAIYGIDRANSSITIKDAVFSKNMAVRDENADQENRKGGQGGAIFSSISMDIDNTIFEDNKSAYQGGAIFLEGDYEVQEKATSIKNSSFKFNKVEKNKGKDGDEGGAIYVFDHTLNDSNNTFEGNKAADGGAIYIYAHYDKKNNKWVVVKGNLNSTSSTFINNTAGYGGAIYLGTVNFYQKLISPELIINKGNFTNNTANKGYGGAIFTLKRSDDNPADVEKYSHIKTDKETEFIDNKALVKGAGNYFIPPVNYKDFTKLEFKTNSFSGEESLMNRSLLNNADINYSGDHFGKVNYKFVSGTEGMSLPDEVMALLPTEVYAHAYENGKPRKLRPVNIKKEVKVDGGTWTFVAWQPQSQEVKENSTISFTGTWTFRLDIPVNKIWKDANGNTLTKNLPESVTVKLIGGEKPQELVLNAENNWRGTFENLPLKDAKGSAIKYRIEEEKVNGYKTAIRGDEKTGFTITNTKINGHPTSLKPILNKKDHAQYLIGYADKSFGPENKMTREEVAVMFSRLLQTKPEKGKVYKNNFKDIKDDRWSATAISYMNELGIIKGYEDGTFKPEKSITRAEFATMASRFDNLPMGDKTFKDVAESYWAYETIKKAATAGWINGYPDGTFRPEENITRSEVVTITNRMLERKADEKFINENQDKITNYRDLDKTNWAYYQVQEATNGHEYTRKTNSMDETWLKVNGLSFVSEK